MRMTAIQAQTERKRRDRFVRRAEKRRHQAEQMRVRGPIRPVSAVGATSDTARCKEKLPGRLGHATLTSDGTLFGEFLLNRLTLPLPLALSRLQLRGNATAAVIGDTKPLLCRPFQATLASNGRPLGKYRFLTLDP